MTWLCRRAIFGPLDCEHPVSRLSERFDDQGRDGLRRIGYPQERNPKVPLKNWPNAQLRVEES